MQRITKHTDNTASPSKRKTINDKFNSIQCPFGGHTPFPPANCPSPRKTIHGGIIWVDNGICTNRCDDAKCDAYKRYSDHLSSNRNQTKKHEEQ